MYSFHFGYTIDNLKLSPSIHYKQYAKFRQLDVGAYFNLNPINVGIWYRGIPIDSNNYLNSLVGSLSLKIENISIVYDYTMSYLSKSISSGSHEISLIFDFHFFGKKLPPKNVRFLNVLSLIFK